MPQHNLPASPFQHIIELPDAYGQIYFCPKNQYKISFYKEEGKHFWYLLLERSKLYQKKKYYLNLGFLLKEEFHRPPAERISNIVDLQKFIILLFSCLIGDKAWNYRVLRLIIELLPYLEKDVLETALLLYIYPDYPIKSN